MRNLEREASYLPRYFFVGAVTFAIDVTVFTILYQLLGRDLVSLATIGGGTAGYLINFFGHRYITFRNERKATVAWEMMMHLPMKFGIQGVRGALMHVFVVMLGFHVVIPFLLVGAVVSVSNFVLSRWIFMRQSPRQLYGYLKHEAPEDWRQARIILVVVRQLVMTRRAELGPPNC